MFRKSLILTTFLTVVKLWDLSEHGFDNNYYTSSIAIYRNRAFLTLPRTICNLNRSLPTLVEVPWTEDVITNLLSPFVLRKKLDIVGQNWGNCKQLQDAISLDVEPKKPNLWVLDKGNDMCPAKLVYYNLFLNSVQQTCVLTGVARNNLNTITIDPQTTEGVKAYIGDAGNNILLVVSLQEFKCSFLAISKSSPVLFMTGWNSTEVFALDLDQLRKDEGPLIIESRTTVTEYYVTYMGNKLGVSRGLETDQKNGLNYYLLRDFAVAQWNINKAMIAENHNILLQSFEKLPYVSQIFNDQQGIWALVNPIDPDLCGSDFDAEDFGNVTARIVKLVRYNKFLL
ncbi:uncharacterized protein LOC109596953 isoform X2 [Aethina tumida]|uniref:uncharacterized protein LOC109596953 isoform X2 n=1 Tax=Aethina tumida TaxID=116153 RepID=UPI002148B068|nr:uncharacterized protein LOC109596953 isoform X2 [Aethina tumida]